MNDANDAELVECKSDTDAVEAGNPELKHILESILFASSEPLSVARITSALKDEFPMKRKQTAALLEELKNDYDRESRGIQLVESAGGFELKTRPCYSRWIRRILKERSGQERLSRPALETLSIIAYKQPITRAEIEEIRGVNVDGVMRVLLDRGLVFPSGKKDVPGKPWLYSTTKSFLINFGIQSIQELPPLETLNLN